MHRFGPGKYLISTAAALWVACGLLAGPSWATTAPDAPAAGAQSVAVGPQYDTTHVYVVPEDVDKFVASFLATFGGQKVQLFARFHAFGDHAFFQTISHADHCAYNCGVVFMG